MKWLLMRINSQSVHVHGMENLRRICNTVIVIYVGIVCARNISKESLLYYFSLPQERIFLVPLINPVPYGEATDVLISTRLQQKMCDVSVILILITLSQEMTDVLGYNKKINKRETRKKFYS